MDWQTDRCAECGFDPHGFGPAELPAAVAGLGRRYRAPLTRFLPGEGESIVRSHPVDGAWSALAYACHVRDVLFVFNERIGRMLTEDNPALGWWDHEAAVEAEGYDAQDPAEVAAALDANAAAMAATLSAVPDGAWERAGTRPAGEWRGDHHAAAVFTVLGAGRYALHEGSHHLLDVGRVLRSARGR